MLPGLAVAQTNGQRPPIGTTRLGSGEARSETIATSKMAVSAGATARPAGVALVGRDYIARQAVRTYGDLLRPPASA